MKIAGHTEDIAAADYARSVGEKVADRVKDALAGQADAVLPEPEDVADALSPLVAYLPEESPNELATLLGPFWSGSRVRQALGLATRQALDSRRSNGSVLGLKTSDGAVVYPVFQFQRRHGEIEVKPSLVPMLRILRDFDSWTVATLLRTPAPELNGLTPLDWTRRDQPPVELVRLANTVAREWAAGTTRWRRRRRRRPPS